MSPVWQGERGLDRWLTHHYPLGRALRWPLRFLPSDLVLPILSGPARGYRWRVNSTIRRAWAGRYDAVAIEAVRRNAPQSQDQIDL
jgi:hypothetical protein